jgi:hypothetical protein
MVLYSSQEIKPDKQDAPEFIKIINLIMGHMVYQYGIHEVCKIKIKNWFDHKWLNYSGKSVIHAEENYDSEHPVLQDEWRKKITVPPFNPNRVISEDFLKKQETGNKRFEKVLPFEKVLHKEKFSNDNIHNRISDYTENGLFIWYSSHSKINQQGSLMVYRVQKDELETWFASVQNKDGWKISQTKGIGINEVRAYTKTWRD